MVLAGKTATGVTVPREVVEALALYPDARRRFDGLTASQQSAFVDPIVQAKKPETRQARVAKAVAALPEGCKRP